GQLESLTAPVREASRDVLRASRSGQTPAPASAPLPVGPARPARQFEPGTRCFTNELAGVLHGRLLAGTSVGAAAFGVLILVELISPRGGSDHLSLTLYTGLAVLYTAMVTWLVRRRDIPLSRLRVIEVVALAAYAATYAWKDFHHYSRYWEALKEREQWLLV